MRRLLVVAVLLFGCDKSSAPLPPPGTTFTPDSWRQQHQDQREPMATELIRTGRLKGLTAAQVTDLLGPSQRTNRYGEGDFNYIVGPSEVDDLWLTIKFKNGVVVETVITSD